MGRRSRARVEQSGKSESGQSWAWFMRRRRWRRRLIGAGLAALLLVAGLGAWQWNAAPAAQEPAPRFNLVGSTGQAYRLDDFLGKQGRIHTRQVDRRFGENVDTIIRTVRDAKLQV